MLRESKEEEEILQLKLEVEKEVMLLGCIALVGKPITVSLNECFREDVEWS